MQKSGRSRKYTRRRFIQHAVTASLPPMLSPPLRARANFDGPYEGKCLVTLQLDGGADVTQFCDPKTNTPGEKKINNWADVEEPRQAGNINFAPVADNEWLFNRFHLATIGCSRKKGGVALRTSGLTILALHPKRRLLDSMIQPAW